MLYQNITIFYDFQTLYYCVVKLNTSDCCCCCQLLSLSPEPEPELPSSCTQLPGGPRSWCRNQETEQVRGNI